MAQHTPGPWAVSRRHDRRVTANGVMICTALLQSGPGKSNSKGEEEAIANARLIAAAPELLGALQYARALLRLKGVEAEQIDTAIAKATGR